MLEERSHQIVELCARVTDLSESSQRLQQEADQANRDREESAEQLLSGNQSRGRLEVQVEELGEELGVWEQRCYKAEVGCDAMLFDSIHSSTASTAPVLPPPPLD